MAGDVVGAELAKALVGFRADMPVVKRTASAQAGSRKYKYADLATVEETAQPHLAKHKLSVTQPLASDDDGFTYVKTIIRHESGESETHKLRVPSDGVTPQQAGSVFTYYRRYAFTAALGIAVEGEDDDGSDGNSAKVPAKQTTTSHTYPASTDRTPSQKQLDLIANLAARKGKDDEWLKKTMAAVKTSADASTVIDKLQELGDA